MKSKTNKIAVLTCSFFLIITLMSCTSNPLVSVNHFQDAIVLEPGESKYFISFEEALFFQFIVTKQSPNDFGRRPFIITPNYHLGIARGYELGVQVLPITTSSAGLNLYFKYSNRLSSITSCGVVLVGGYTEANGDNGEGITLGRNYAARNSKISNFNIMLPFTVTEKFVSFTIAPNIGNYRADIHGTDVSDNELITNYLVPGVSTGISFNLPLDSFISLELSTLQIEHTVVGFYGVAFGMKSNLF